MGFAETYEDWFIQRGDPRVEKWPLLKDPFKLMCIIATYLYAINYYLPRYMKNRKPFDLKLVIQVYNIVQVLGCTYVVFMFLKNGWLFHYSLGCQPVNYSNDPREVKILETVYFVFWIKIVELVETCFFTLRHKSSQITFLHLYHHVSTLAFAWITVKYMGGGMMTLAQLINSMIHIIMYSYYFLAAFGPSMQKRLEVVKSKITTIQMVQFGLLFVHSLQALKASCAISKPMAVAFITNMVILFALFLNFYVQSYRRKLKAK